MIPPSPRRRPAERNLFPPPDDEWLLATLEVNVARVLHRFSWVGHTSPGRFGRDVQHRFDSPDGSFGVCYLGTSFNACFVEVILPKRKPRAPRRFVTLKKLLSYRAVTVSLNRPLRLARFAGASMVSMGLDTRVTGGNNYDLSRAWSAAVHRRTSPSEVDGILYPTRHQNDLYSIALFDRAGRAVRFVEHGVLGDRTSGRVWTACMKALKRYELDVIA